MQPTIRRITLADAVALAALSATTFYDTFTGTCTEEDMQEFLQEYFNLDQVKLELSNENDLYFFAEIEGQPVGYLRIMEDYSNFPLMKKWKALELKRIYVDKGFHGKGIAQLLMQFAEDFAIKHQYEVLWLGVWEHNLRAKNFYNKTGFIDSGHTHDFPIGTTPQTDNWLWKFLDEAAAAKITTA
jgi:ribosomal protein S18 acetylase RimI-like enzyme